MQSMFYKAILFNKDISVWDTSKLTDMLFMFAGAKKFNRNISKWNITQWNISKWNIDMLLVYGTLVLLLIWIVCLIMFIL